LNGGLYLKFGFEVRRRSRALLFVIM
jgi:hypothetical protein